MSTSTQPTTEALLAEALLLRADIADLGRKWDGRFAGIDLQLDRLEAGYRAILDRKGPVPIGDEPDDT